MARGASRNGYIALFQGTPLLMQLFLMFFGLPMLGFRIEPWTAAVLALTFFASAYLAEIWRGGVEALPRGQWDAGASLGLTTSRSCGWSSCRRPSPSPARRWSASWCS